MAGVTGIKKLSLLNTGTPGASVKLVGVESGPKDRLYGLDAIVEYINGQQRQIQTKRAATGDVATGNSQLITVTWDTPFADGAYTATVSLLDVTPATQSMYIVHMEQFALDHIKVRVQNDSAGTISATVHAIAIHD